MGDVVVCTTDGSVFDDVTDLGEILGISSSNANGNQTDLELSVRNWHYEVIGWFVLGAVVVVGKERLAAAEVYKPVKKGQGVVWLAGRGAATSSVTEGFTIRRTTVRVTPRNGEPPLNLPRGTRARV